ncbi:4-aminobutyrate aminotransferase, mitochondrial-like [Oscarella lobularis]|uniref:4-aminobutyrate aminotransferase, mitochondrial-like n=1 Tax=Oscarella lobularis TaxID=121494 RepID=UPI0033142A6F
MLAISRFRSSFRILAAASFSADASADFSGPEVKTRIPGPESLRLISELNKIQESRAVDIFIDFKKSRGNYVYDADGNRLLDVCNHIASLPLGYNHPDILSALQDPGILHLLAHRPALGIAPPTEFVHMLESSLLAVAPAGLTDVMTMMCGACAVENAFKTAFLHYQRRERGETEPTDEEYQSCLRNEPPGSPNLTVLTFKGSFHGRTFGALSATRSKYLHKLDLPAFDWPAAPFPQLKYPLDEHEQENRREEMSCLDAVRNIAREWSERGKPVACLSVEPIQSEGGDRHATPYFFRELQTIAKDIGALFHVDEVQTFGITGKLWAHEHWDLPHSPDIVTFAKKLQTSGAFVRPGLRPDRSWRIFNTWMGDPSKMIIADAVVKCIKKHDLVQKTGTVGAGLLKGLNELQERYPAILSRARGAGTLCSIDCRTSQLKDEVVKALQNEGIYIIGCGERTIRLRPSLVFEDRHAAVFLDIFDAVLARQPK